MATLPEFFNVTVELLGAYGREWTACASVLGDYGIGTLGNVNANLGLGLLLTQTPYAIANVVVVHGLDVTETCSGVALKKEEIADAVQSRVGGKVNLGQEFEFVTRERNHLYLLFLDLEFAVCPARSSSSIGSMYDTHYGATH
ncbi:MAG: hypothetical protein IPM83_03830 [Ignavibacteria bacterium]|nr:hypothetical protein [Ignavibacteria bacterium]